MKHTRSGGGSSSSSGDSGSSTNSGSGNFDISSLKFKTRLEQRGIYYGYFTHGSCMYIVNGVLINTNNLLVP
jgi:hypothetical protein